MFCRWGPNVVSNTPILKAINHFHTWTASPQQVLARCSGWQSPTDVNYEATGSGQHEHWGTQSIGGEGFQMQKKFSLSPTLHSHKVSPSQRYVAATHTQICDSVALECRRCEDDASACLRLSYTAAMSRSSRYMPRHSLPNNSCTRTRVCMMHGHCS